MPNIQVLDSTMAYREEGSGTPFVFLHGNPTSSYMWRKILPVAGTIGRALAPDLIGMGESGRPDSAYRFDDHARYLDAWFDAMELEDVVLVGQDWGGALAFDWAARHPGRTRAITFMETIIRPLTWNEIGEGARPMFRAFRTEGEGEALVLEQNVFIERALRGSAKFGISDEDMVAYRAPYPTPASRRPLLQWPRELPLDGQPADVTARVEAYDLWLSSSLDVPKLLLTSEPGSMTTPEVVEWCRQNVSALEVEACGEAGHCMPEDQPDAIASALLAWAARHGLS